MNAYNNNILDTVLETEEDISSEEFLARRKQGKIKSEDVEILYPTPQQPWGGFKVKLPTPRYRAVFDKEATSVLK